MNKSYISFYYLQFFYCYTTFSNSCSNKSNKTVYIKSYKVILKTQIMTLLTLLIIIMKFLLQYSTSKSLFKNVISDDKGRIRKQTISIPKNVKKSILIIG